MAHMTEAMRGCPSHRHACRRKRRCTMLHRMPCVLCHTVRRRTVGNGALLHASTNTPHVPQHDTRTTTGGGGLWGLDFWHKNSQNLRQKLEKCGRPLTGCSRQELDKGTGGKRNPRHFTCRDAQKNTNTGQRNKVCHSHFRDEQCTAPQAWPLEKEERKGTVVDGAPSPPPPPEDVTRRATKTRPQPATQGHK